MEVNFGGEFQYGDEFLLDGGEFFSRKSKTCYSVSSFFNKGKSTYN
jgi:hypothetical protein